MLFLGLVSSSGIAAAQGSYKPVPTGSNKAANTGQKTPKTSTYYRLEVMEESRPAPRSESVYKGTEFKQPPASLQPEPTLANPRSNGRGAKKSGVAY